MLKNTLFFNPIFKPLKKIFSQKLDAKIRSYTETVPITEFSKDDVFIVGYPKSGNSWFQNIIAGIVYGVNPAKSPDSLVQDLVPDVHYKRYYRRYSTPMFFKSHYSPRPDYRRVVYLLRDGRDVMVSYFRFLEVMKAKQNQKVNFINMVCNGEGLFQKYKWHEHVQAWLSNPYDADMITVRYENLINEPVSELQKLCQFLDMEVDQLSLEKVIQGSSFGQMRRKEAKLGLNNPGWPKDKFFTRRGKIGSYKDEMPPEVLDAFLQEAGDTLKNLGYSA